MTKEQLLEEIQRLPDGSRVEFLYRERPTTYSDPVDHWLEFETVKIAQGVIELVAE